MIKETFYRMDLLKIQYYPHSLYWGENNIRKIQMKIHTFLHFFSELNPVLHEFPIQKPKPRMP